MTVYHEDAPGQPNGRFGHRDDWAQHCALCGGMEANVFFVDEMPQDAAAVLTAGPSSSEPDAGPEVVPEGPEHQNERTEPLRGSD